MLRIASADVEKVRSTDDIEGLREQLQRTIALEHATIPTYLYALFSIKPGRNAEAASILRAIVIDEMLHRTIVGNVLIAIGGQPAIDDPKFVPRFPGPLPLHVSGLQVHLRPLSQMQIREVFMEIEDPEYPVPG